MKSTLSKATTTILFLTVLAVTQVFGQAKPYENPKYGADSAIRMECVKNISLYSEFYKQKNYNDAVNPWREVFENCPKASKNTFLRGANIYKNLIAREKDVSRKNAFIDTLMLIYDKRIETFGGEGKALGLKGADLYGYKGKAAAQEVNDMLKKSITLEKKKSKSAIVSMYMQTTVDLYRAESIDPTGVIESYTLCMGTLDVAKVYNEELAKSGNPKREKYAKIELPKIETSYGNVEALFSESGAANCDALIAIFEPQFETSKSDIEWLKKINKLLNQTDCNDSEFFAKMSEQQYSMEPSAEAAHNLARLFLKKEEYEKAKGYYKEATSLQEDSITKSLYYYEWSTLAMAQKDYPKVRELSYNVIKYNPKDGRPYLMIGKAYAQTKGIGKEKVEANTVYWVAIDKFKKAKRVDPAIAEQANEYITTYSKYYPNFEEWFMAVGIAEGENYTVGGWINEKTKVRFK